MGKERKLDKIFNRLNWLRINGLIQMSIMVQLNKSSQIGIDNFYSKLKLLSRQEK